MTATFVGLYSLRRMSSLRPKLANTSLHKLVLNIAIIQLVSSSFPVVARTLGLISFDLLGYYSSWHQLRNDIWSYLYKIVFILVLSHQYFQLFPTRNFYAMRVGLSLIRQLFIDKSSSYQFQELQEHNLRELLCKRRIKVE